MFTNFSFQFVFISYLTTKYSQFHFFPLVTINLHVSIKFPTNSMLGKNRSSIYLHMRICLSAKCLKACFMSLTRRDAFLGQLSFSILSIFHISEISFEIISIQILQHNDGCSVPAMVMLEMRMQNQCIVGLSEVYVVNKRRTDKTPTS